VAVVTVLAAVIGLQLGALGVVMETQLSGISSLPFTNFLLLMQPIHLAIGLVEGLATAALIGFIREARPDLVSDSNSTCIPAHGGLGFPTRIIALLMALALVTGASLSWFASSNPDGLEWSIARVTGKPEIEADSTAVHQTLAQWQHQIAAMPDYKLTSAKASGADASGEAKPEETWPAVDAETTLAGVIGGLGTLILVTGIAYLLRPRRARLPQ